SGSLPDDDDDEFQPDTNHRSSQHFYTRSDTFIEESPLTERPARLTGPIQAPPGLFKPDSSKEIPNNIISLDDVDTKVDDIILDFLRMESTTKDDPDQ
ncbi:hypothetical protein KJ865_15580, partial [Myxococcota bacterium]|nr:hypothetical protein [Myxococcota bacterium]